jgi:DNA-binding response OmpR family regulator
MDIRVERMFHEAKESPLGEEFDFMKLLVIDDLEAVGMIVAEIAAQGGWQSMHCTQADDIVKLIRKEKIDIILMDYFMPGRSGLDLTTQIRAEGLQLPVIFFSGMASQIDRVKAAALGVVRILEKPLSIKELRKALADAGKDLEAKPEAEKGRANR